MSSNTIHQGLKSLNANGCCNQLYQASSEAMNWVVKNGKIAGTYVADALKKVANWAKGFFTMLGGQIAKGFQFVKFHSVEGYKKAKDIAQKNPGAMAAVAIAFAAGSALTALFCRCCCKKAANAPENAPNQTAAATANV